MPDITGRLAARLIFLLLLGAGLTNGDDEFVRRDHGRVNRPSAKSPHRIRGSCPLCAARGRDVPLVAELDLTTRSTVVADLSGCPHAEAFGRVGLLTLDEEWRLITAALDAWEARRA